jgi:hypothetical protein
LCGATTETSLGRGDRGGDAGVRGGVCSRWPLFRAKALARFLLVKWRRRFRVSLSLLRVPFWNCYPVAHRLRVKTRSSSWTSDGGAYRRLDLLGGVASRDIFARRIGLLLVVALAGGGLSVVGQGKGGCLPSPWCLPSVGGRGSSFGCGSPARSVPRRLGMLDTLQYGAGHR